MTTKAPKLNTDEFFILWVLLAQTRDAISKARHRELELYHINKERRAILWCVHNDGGESTPVKIARQLFKELNSISEMLKRMESIGLVSISKKSKRSSATVRMTPKGEEIFYQSRVNEVDKRIFSALPKRRRKSLASDLWTIRNQALRELGIPEWHVNFPMDPSISGEIDIRP